MAKNSVDTKSDDSAVNKDEIEYEETIDMILLEGVNEIKKQTSREDFLEIWNFLRELDSLDDDKLKEEIKKYSKYRDENHINEIMNIIKQCEVIKECKGQKDCEEIKKSKGLKQCEVMANCKNSQYCKFKTRQSPFGFDYNSAILLMFCCDVFKKKHKKDQHKKSRMIDAIHRMNTEGEVNTMIGELCENTTFDLAKEQYNDILINIYTIGILIGSIRHMTVINSDDLENSIKSRLGAKHGTKGWKILNSIKDIIRQIANEKYDNGDTTWHNDMAKILDTNVTVFKNGNEHKITDEVFLKRLPELKKLMEAVDSAFEKHKKKHPFEKYKKKHLSKKCKETNKELTLEDYKKDFYNQYIGINMIQDTIKEVAYSYKRVYGVHNTNRVVPK
jgi:hypothetical protein